jgi:membrane-associated protein
MILKFINTILHIDVYLNQVVQSYPTLTYLFLFAVVFLETGVVVTPFLPGDSLLFTVGAIAATGALKIEITFPLLLIAAVAGDAANYHIGRAVGPKIFSKENSFLFHKEHLVRAQKFYEKYGNKTILLARFIPVMRTFAPFVAGIGTMKYSKFVGYNVAGAFIWCTLFMMGGYFFGGIPAVQEHFSWVIIGIIGISIVPVIKEIVFHFFSKKKV